MATPILDHNQVVLGALLAQQTIDDNFAHSLTEEINSNVVLCKENQILASTMRWFSFSASQLCKPDQFNSIDGSQHFVALAKFAKDKSSLVIVDIEPLYNIDAHVVRLLEILVFMGLFVFALGVIAYTFITRYFFIHPLRRLQTQVRTLMANNATHNQRPQPTMS